MNIALIGSGGREHALCQKIHESKLSKNIAMSSNDLLYGSIFNSLIILNLLRLLFLSKLLHHKIMVCLDYK